MSKQKLKGLPVWAVVKIACSFCAKPTGSAERAFCEPCAKRARELVRGA